MKSGRIKHQEEEMWRKTTMSSQGRSQQETERLKKGYEMQNLEKDLMNLAIGYMLKQNRIDLPSPLLTYAVLYS